MSKSRYLMSEKSKIQDSGHLTSKFMHLATVHCACVCVCVCVCVCACVLSCTKSRWLFATLWTIARQDPLFVEFFQARILEWVAISYSRESSWPRDQTCISCVSALAGGFFTTEPPGKSHLATECTKKSNHGSTESWRSRIHHLRAWTCAGTK